MSYCLNSPCVGYSGCNTRQSYEDERECIKTNCFCDIGPQKTLAPGVGVPTEVPMCITCGKFNSCEMNKSLHERQDCLSKNCGALCMNFMDTFPPLPVEPFVYVPLRKSMWISVGSLFGFLIIVIILVIYFHRKMKKQI